MTTLDASSTKDDKEDDQKDQEQRLKLITCEKSWKVYEEMK